MSIDLDALERLAANASPGPWIEALPDIDAQLDEDCDFIIACDPVTVAALTRAVKTDIALTEAQTASANAWNACKNKHPHGPERKAAYAADETYRAARVAHFNALAPFRDNL